ncbi:MAG TPA: DNA polymerase IV [Acidimicrobiales bacterium]|nr:DNA polymerase IV [Acidimicrobiales bacterium]
MAGPTPIVHVDMDAFYAAVEVRDDPSLAGRPLVVGGAGSRGVVASCSYEARAFGVRSAMPSARARALCPHAVFLPGRFERYREASAAIHAVFHEVTPLVEGIALDEAFLDVGGAERLLGPAPAIGAALRDRIAAATGLTCSVGVARTKFLAKLASEAAKPTAGPGGVRAGPGIVVVDPEREQQFLHPLPVEALWGVGPATAARLRRIGLGTVGELASVSVDVLERAVGRAAGAHLHRLAHGIDERPVVADRAAKSVGHEETYARDHHEQEPCRREVLRMADAVADRLRAGGTGGRTVTLKVRFGDFTTITRSRTLAGPVDTGRAIGQVAAELLAGVDVGPGVRLLGVSVANLAPVERRDEQLSLLDPVPAAAGARTLSEGWGAAAEAVDSVRRRFGAASIATATLLGPAGLRVKRQGDTQWGPTDDEPPVG